MPSLNFGTNYDLHNGPIQQSNGNILSLNRSALYVGSGANVVAAGTIHIPGVLISYNLADVYFTYLASRQNRVAKEAMSIAVRNQMFLDVTLAYSELLRAEGHRAISVQARDEAREIARLTSEYATTGAGRVADANRAATELAKREAILMGAEGDILRASARLCELLNLDPSIRLHPTDAFVVPHPIVPPPMAVAELIAVGLLNRPELRAQRAMIAEAMISLEGSKVLPFSPTVIAGFSAGVFGGGSNLVRPIFGGFGGRSDFDVITYWTLRNFGVGNVAMIRLADAHLQMARFEQIRVLNLVRAEVAEAYAKAHARFAQITASEQAVQAGREALREDYDRTLARAEREVLPIELLNSFRLLAQSRYDYLDSIVDYDRSQFELYVALGQPPADVLARPVPTQGISPSGIPARPGNAPAASARAGRTTSAPGFLPDRSSSYRAGRRPAPRPDGTDDPPAHPRSGPVAGSRDERWAGRRTLSTSSAFSLKKGCFHAIAGLCEAQAGPSEAESPPVRGSDAAGKPLFRLRHPEDELACGRPEPRTGVPQPPRSLHRGCPSMPRGRACPRLTIGRFVSPSGWAIRQVLSASGRSVKTGARTPGRIPSITPAGHQATLNSDLPPAGSDGGSGRIVERHSSPGLRHPPFAFRVPARPVDGLAAGGGTES